MKGLFFGSMMVLGATCMALSGNAVHMADAVAVFIVTIPVALGSFFKSGLAE